MKVKKVSKVAEKTLHFLSMIKVKNLSFYSVTPVSNPHCSKGQSRSREEGHPTEGCLVVGDGDVSRCLTWFLFPVPPPILAEVGTNGPRSRLVVTTLLSWLQLHYGDRREGTQTF